MPDYLLPETLARLKGLSLKARLIVEGYEHRTGATSPAAPGKADAE